MDFAKALLLEIAMDGINASRSVREFSVALCKYKNVSVGIVNKDVPVLPLHCESLLRCLARSRVRVRYPHPELC